MHKVTLEFRTMTLILYPDSQNCVLISNLDHECGTYTFDELIAILEKVGK